MNTLVVIADKEGNVEQTQLNNVLLNNVEYVTYEVQPFEREVVLTIRMPAHVRYFTHEGDKLFERVVH